jgi:hypothetical protein
MMLLQRLADLGPDVLPGIAVFFLLSFGPGLAVLLAVWRPLHRVRGAPSRGRIKPVVVETEAHRQVRETSTPRIQRRSEGKAIAAR